MARSKHRQSMDAQCNPTIKGWYNGWRAWCALNANELTWTVLVIGGVVFTAMLVGR